MNRTEHTYRHFSVARVTRGHLIRAGHGVTPITRTADGFYTFDVDPGRLEWEARGETELDARVVEFDTYR